MKALVFALAKLCLHVLAAVILVGILVPLFVLGVVIFVGAAIVRNYADAKDRRGAA